ncbi:MAG: NADPH-dependent fmn reductase [Aeromicrobium sp.]|nr:NADPH-dependent fmn reductase [Aeromicrobium sp.]
MTYSEADLNTVVVVGNPKLGSRTGSAAALVAERLMGRPAEATVEVASLGGGLLEWGDAAVAGAVDLVCAADVVVVASPTFKASYTGLLKLFLDQFPNDALLGVQAFPLMLGAGPGHALAAELLLKPVLVELGASCPARALYLLDSSWQDLEVIDRWAVGARDAARISL